MLTYAQNFEDVMLARLFGGQDTGFYVDVGASHPESLSVTKHFYDLGWSGINVEPIPASWRLLTEQRPRDINVNAAIDVEEAERTFYEVAELGALSTYDPDQVDFLKQEGYHLTSYSIKTLRLDSIFDKYVKDTVDFLKIDVEGSEESVIRSLNLTKHRPRVLVIEAMKPARAFPGWGRHNEVDNWGWEAEVTANDYVFAYYDGISRFYVRTEDLPLVARFALPPGCFDDIHRPEEEELRRQNTDLIGQLGRLAEQLQQTTGEKAELAAEKAELAERLRVVANAGVGTRIRDLVEHVKGRVKETIKAGIWRICSRPTAIPLPKISVVTPVFNGEAHIAETIESVLRQEYPEVEYIIVDGGSSDGTLEIVRAYEKRDDLFQRVSLVISEPDRGMYDALAKGFQKATGEVFCYLNADDFFECGGLKSVGEHFARHSAAQVIYHEDVVLVDGWKYPNIRQPETIGTADLLAGHILFQDGVFWRRGAYEEIGGFRRDLRLAGDFDLWLRLSARVRFERRPGHVSCFRMRPGQLSTQMDLYAEEMRNSINEFLGRTTFRSRVRWAANRAVRVWGRRLWGRWKTDRLFFPIDFANIPPPAVTIPASNWDAPRSPIDSQPAERLLFSTPDTRFGEKEINYIYLDTRHGIAITHPAISAGRLDGLYRQHYSDPPTEIKLPLGKSPYRQFNRKRIWERALLRLPVEKAGRFRPNVWGDNTLLELLEVLNASQVDTRAKLRFLDTGCFEGQLLSEIRERTSWQGFGLEPNDYAVGIARGKGLHVWHGHAEQAGTIIPCNQQFDVVFLGQSVEHLGDPVRVLRRMRLLLAPEGSLVMSTPNLDSREIDWFGPTWAHWHAPYHRYIFSRKGLYALARQVGMLPVHFQSFSHPYWTTMSIAQNHMGLGGSASHAVTFDREFCLQAQRVNFWQYLLWNRAGKGDYCYMVLKDTADDRVAASNY